MRIRDAETGGRFAKSPFVPAIDCYHWFAVNGNSSELGGFDRHGLRAILALLRHVTGIKNTMADLTPEAMRKITLPTGQLPSSTATNLLTEVSLWGDLEHFLGQGQDLIIRRRP